MCDFDFDSASECAPQAKGRDSIDDLLKSIGVSEPASAHAPAVSLRDAVGGVASISGNRGNSILVNFWATWCERSDELSVLGKVSGASEYWYMVRTKNGLVGWARESEVEAASNQK